MSHVVQIKTQVRDPVAIQLACQRLGLAPAGQETVQLFATSVSGLIVRLPGWRYPVVIDLMTANVQYDNYGGHWGDQKELDRFLQAYVTEKAKLEARKRGHSITEQQLAGGSIKLTIQVGGGVA